MPVFPLKTLGSIMTAFTSASQAIYARMPLILTPDEIVAAFISPQHLHTLQEVQALFGKPLTSGSQETWLGASDSTNYRAALAFGGTSPLTMPPYAADGILPSCPPELVKKICDWVDSRVQTAVLITDTMRAMPHLNEGCGDMAAMRLVFPALPLIISRMDDEGLQKRMAKATGVKRVGRLPKLTPEQADRLAEGSALLNMLLLMDKAPVKIEPQHAAVWIETAGRSYRSLFAEGASELL